MCLLDGIARDQISQASPAVFHTGSDEIVAVGTAWEQGYKQQATISEYASQQGNHAGWYLSLLKKLGVEIKVSTSVGTWKGVPD